MLKIRVILLPGYFIFLLFLLGASGAPKRTVYNGTPANYLSLLAILQPGDTLSLAAGAYPVGEPLFQGEGNVALYNNLFLNNNGSAVGIQPHNDVPKMIRVFNNTVVANGTGISVTGGDSGFEQKVIGNAAFANTPINAADTADNITDSYANAVGYLVNPGGSPTGSPTQLDLYPKAGMLAGSPIDSASFNVFQDWNLDFNRDTHDGTFRGAYAGSGANSGWLPKLERKPLVQVAPPVLDEFIYLPMALK
jgi:hypothetical protein